MPEPVIELRDVGMQFRLHYEKAYTLKETFINLVKRRNGYRDLWAVHDITFDMAPGESIGLIGRNGSGKSTLLKIIAGVFEPTKGVRRVRGSVAALMELGAGFNGELTGRENVFLNGAIMGFGKAEMKQRYDRIVEFSELHEFMDVPVKNYSSGMYARLGFAIATDVDADLLLIDETLSVGDEAFQQKCFERINSLLSGGKSVIFVSHDATSVARLCRRAILLHHGGIVSDGPTQEVLERYHQLLAGEMGSKT
jgi:ABC-type polysaccharide/polyol phosphate transport system ATPase subunit